MNIKEFPLLPTTVFEHCFDLGALEKIKNEIHSENICLPYIHDWERENKGKTFSNRYQGNWNNPSLRQLILSGLPDVISHNIIVESIIHLQSFIPYEFHCDYGWSEPGDDECPFVVVIIPFETIDAKTIVCNQYMHGLHFIHYKEQSAPLPVEQQMPEEEYLKYFSHCWPQERPYISIDKIFEWKAGSALVFDQRYIHASDNFLKHGLTEKNCISIFSKIKRENYHGVLEILKEQPEETV